MENIAYYNGRTGRIEDMMIPMNDRSTFFGDGVYDATGYSSGSLHCLDEHIERFYRSANLVRIKIPVSREELKKLLEDLCRQVDGDYLFVYWQTTRGTAPRAHEFPPAEVPANLLVTVKPIPWPDFETRIKLTEMEDRRYEFCNIKTINLLPNVLAAQKAAEEGCEECVFHRGETVTECAHSNISILKNGTLITHPADCHILPGIGRAHMIGACKALGIPVEERPYTLSELRDADEALVSSSGKLCRLAAEFCHKPIGGKDTSTALRILDYMRKEINV